MGGTGLEPSANSREKPHKTKTTGADSGALPPDLARVVNAWPGLPAQSRKAITRIVWLWTHDGIKANETKSPASDAGKVE